MLSTSAEPAPQFPSTLDEYDGEGDGEESISELGKDMLQAFEEQERRSAAAGSHRPRQHVARAATVRIGTTEPRGASSEGEEDLAGKQGAEGGAEGQQHEEGDKLEAYLDDGEKEGAADNSKDEDYSRNTSDEDDEEEDSRPAKRRKFPSPLSEEGFLGIR